MEIQVRAVNQNTPIKDAILVGAAIEETMRGGFLSAINPIGAGLNSGLKALGLSAVAGGVVGAMTGSTERSIAAAGAASTAVGLGESIYGTVKIYLGGIEMAKGLFTGASTTTGKALLAGGAKTALAGLGVCSAPVVAVVLAAGVAGTLTR